MARVAKEMWQMAGLMVVPLLGKGASELGGVGGHGGAGRGGGGGVDKAGGLSALGLWCPQGGTVAVGKM